MLKSFLAFAAFLAGAVALPVTDEGGIAVTEARSPAMPMEESGMCYLPAGSTCASKAQQIKGDADDGKKAGLVVQNKDSADHSFFIYQNNCNCVPYKYISIPANSQKFIAFDNSFEGRIMRGTESVNLDGQVHLLGTWVEFSWDDKGWGWADVSLIKGCDGAVDITAIDGIGAKTGFSKDVLNGAPSGAYMKKPSGNAAIMHTESLTDPAVINEDPRNWLAGKLGYTNAYIDDWHGNPDICSVNGRFHINFYPGRS